MTTSTMPPHQAPATRDRRASGRLGVVVARPESSDPGRIIAELQVLGANYVVLGLGSDPSAGEHYLPRETLPIGRRTQLDPCVSAADVLSGTELILRHIEAASAGTDLLLGVAVDDEGRVPAAQRAPVAILGNWLRATGEAVLHTSAAELPGSTTDTGAPVRFTRNENTLFAIVIADELAPRFTLMDAPATASGTARLLGTCVEAKVERRGTALEVQLPGAASGQPAYALAFDSAGT